MSYAFTTKELSQLKAVIQSPILMLEVDDLASTLLATSQILRTSRNCCVVVAVNSTRNKLKDVKNLHRIIASLKHLRHQLITDRPYLQTSLIGIYPSLEYPACVYELTTSADRYVTANVLPIAGSTFTGKSKQFISRLIGANPAVGGLGLILYKE